MFMAIEKICQENPNLGFLKDEMPQHILADAQQHYDHFDNADDKKALMEIFSLAMNNAPRDTISNATALYDLFSKECKENNEDLCTIIIDNTYRYQKLAFGKVKVLNEICAHEDMQGEFQEEILKAIRYKHPCSATMYASSILEAFKGNEDKLYDGFITAIHTFSENPVEEFGFNNLEFLDGFIPEHKRKALYDALLHDMDKKPESAVRMKPTLEKILPADELRQKLEEIAPSSNGAEPI